MPDEPNDGIRILGFSEDEIELVLMSVQCIKPSKRFASGWEIGMKTFADLTNTSIVTARAQWKDLNSRLMKLPRLSRKSPSPRPNEESEDMTTQDCIIVRDEIGNAPAAGDESEREAKYKTKAKGKRKQVAKPSIIDDEDYDLDEEEDRTGAKMMAKAKGKGAVVAKQSVSDDSTKKAWADVGDGMDEEKWNQMGDKLAF